MKSFKKLCLFTPLVIAASAIIFSPVAAAKGTKPAQVKRCMELAKTKKAVKCTVSLDVGESLFFRDLDKGVRSTFKGINMERVAYHNQHGILDVVLNYKGVEHKISILEKSKPKGRNKPKK